MDIKLKLYKKGNQRKVSVDLPVPNEKNILIKTNSGLIIHHKKSFYFYDQDILGYYTRDKKSSWYIYPLTHEQVGQIITDSKYNFWKLKFESAINFGFFYNHYFIDNKKTETIKFLTPLEENKLNYPDGLQPAEIKDLDLTNFLLQTKSNDMSVYNNINYTKAVWRDLQIDKILKE